MAYLPAVNAADALGAAKALRKKDHPTTDYGGGITSQHGHLTVNGHEVGDLDYEQASSALRHLQAWRDDRGLTTANSRAEVEKLKAQVKSAYPEYIASRMEEYQAAALEYQNAMLGMYERMAAAAEQPPVYQQPINDVSGAASKAERDTRSQQLMRRGLLSLTRFGDGGGGKRQTSGVAA